MPNDVDVVRYPRYRLSSTIISHAVCLYYRFQTWAAVGVDLTMPFSDV